MELRAWAIQILGGASIEEKLYAPPELTDENPGVSILWKEPNRAYPLRFQPYRRGKNKLPPLHTHHLPDNRAICLHRFASHELQAVEIMAYAILAFPEAPSSFRMGVAHILKEEQNHTQLYIDAMKPFGLQLDDLPHYRHFWAYVKALLHPIQYISTMNLTFEMANLDFAPIYGESFKRNGDLASSLLMDRIFQDEMDHVGFGWRWLEKFKSPEQSSWQCWKEALPSHLLPKHAKGFIFNETAREQIGIEKSWILNLKML